VLGIEAWDLSEDAEGPRVLGWSEYKVDLDGPWDEIVRASGCLALAELEKAKSLGDIYVNVTWLSATDYVQKDG